MNTARYNRCSVCGVEDAVQRAGLMQGSTLCRECADELQELIDRWQKNQFRVKKATDIEDVDEAVRDEFTEEELIHLASKTRISVFDRDEDPRNV